MDHISNRDEELAQAYKLIEALQLGKEQQGKELQESRERDKELEELREQTRPTTLEELLEHGDALHRSLKVEEHESRQTKGGARDPKGKECPRKLQKWTSCIDDFQASYNTLYNLLNPQQDSQTRLFISRKELDGVKQTIPNQPVGSKKALTQFLGNAVESIISHIIRELAKNPSYRLPLELKDNVLFGFDINSLNDAASDVAHRQDIHEAPLFANKICCAQDHKDELEPAKLLFIVEQKAPHKLPIKVVRAGLRDMDIMEVIQKYKVSLDEEQRYRERAEILVAAVLSQAYSYMLKGGLEFGVVETGEVYVFLKVLPHDSNTLWYHLAVPGEDVSAVDRLDFAHPFRAIGQLLAFLLMAFKSQRQDQDWRDRAVKSALLWVDVDRLHEQIDADEKAQGIKPDTGLETAFSPYYGPKQLELKSSPYALRYRKKRPSQCKEQEDSVREDSDNDTEHQRQSKRHEDTPTRKPPVAKERNIRGSSKSTGASRSTNNKNMPFCTHQCLLGIKIGMDLDANCPNLHLHRGNSESSKHRLNRDKFASRVRKQLAKSLVKGVTDLEIQGSRGRLFKVTLLSHGYTFVAKGTRDVFIADLQHEARVYNRLFSLQGDLIPVCLGNINLKNPWWDVGVCIIHMLLMSYAGESVDRMYIYSKEEKTITRKMEELGVEHMDLRWPNILVDKETQRVMIIDFERSKLSATVPSKRPLREGTGNTSPTKSAGSSIKKPLQDKSGNVSPVKATAQDLSSTMSAQKGYLFHLLPDSDALNTVIE